MRWRMASACKGVILPAVSFASLAGFAHRPFFANSVASSIPRNPR
jgi:hypothetical protein